MNINNVMLVRAMTHLPLNGELIPSYEGERLVCDKQSEFHNFIKECVENDMKSKLGRDLSLYYESPDALQRDEIMKDYEVLVGDYYTTTLSFSLNGLVPNDINNNFSDMKIAVLEPLKNQVNADFVTVETIDTTVKGRMKVSDEAKLLIEQEYFSSLTQDEQENLMSNYQVNFFNGSLKDAVDNTLRSNGYPALDLVQKREWDNIRDCEEKEGMLKFEDEFAEKVGASRMRLQHLTFQYGGGTGVDKIAHDKISEEFDNNLVVKNHYRNQLYDFMLTKADNMGVPVTEEERFYLYTEYQNGEDAMRKITAGLINAYGGLENFKGFIQEYNQYVKDNYKTNKEIFELSNSIGQK